VYIVRYSVHSGTGKRSMSVNDHRTAPTVDEFEVKEGRDQFSSTVIFGNEDHTLGEDDYTDVEDHDYD